MNRLIITLSLAALTLAGCGSAKTVSDSDKKLSRKAAEEYSKVITAEWIADSKTAVADVYNKQLAKDGELEMPLWWKVYGEKPSDGYSLYISLHGGGGAPPRLNDGQWDNQKKLYAPKNAVYVAPRAPWNTWDLWFHEGIDPLYEQVIRMAVAYLDVNPDKVYIMGYSAGGDGVWREAPRMADHWAAASMMAGHPGDVGLVNLRNTPFMIWCGGEDAAYERNTRCRERGEEMDALQKADPEGYIHKTTIVEGAGHWMNRIDTAAVSWMAQYKRNPAPKKIVWKQEEVLKRFFYWVEAPENQLARGKEVRLSVDGSRIVIERCDYPSLTLWLNDAIVDLDRPVKVEYSGKTLFEGKLRRSSALMKESLYERNDPGFIYSAKVTVSL